MTCTVRYADVDAVIVTYNSAAVIRRCLETLTREGGARLREIIVVDNDSHDDTLSIIAREYPGVRTVPCRENLGFAAANNVGIARAQGAYVLCLNPDAFVHPGAIDALAGALDADSEAAVVGPRLLNDDGSLQFSARNFPTPGNQLFEAVMLHAALPRASVRAGEVIRDPRFYQRTQSAQWLSGAVLMIRREAIERVGGFDERFFLYSEEKDLQYRLAKARWRTVLCPEAVVTHAHGDTYRPELFALAMRSKLAYFRKHYGRGKRLVFSATMLLFLAVRTLGSVFAAVAGGASAGRLAGYRSGMRAVLTRGPATGGTP